MVNLLVLLLTSISFAQAPAPVCEKPVSLSQKDVAELILKQGRKTKETNLTYLNYRLAMVQAREAYQWNLTARAGYLIDKSEKLGSSNGYEKQESLLTDLGLAKAFTTGTKAELNFHQTSFKGEPLPGPEFAALKTLATQDYLSLKLTQDIWANFFGIADRATLDSADLKYDGQQILRTNALEDLTLEAISQYWTTYVSERTFRDALASRDRSKRLVDAVKKKSGFGYANPGELSQAQADLEGRNQKVKTTSTDYLKNSDDLLTLLGLQTGCEVQFSISEVIPTVPQLPPKDVEQSRVIRSQKLITESARRDYDAAASKDNPQVQVVGEAFTYGLDDKTGAAYNEMMAGSKPTYYIGLQLTYPFGDNIKGETRLNKKYAKELEETKLSRFYDETRDRLVQAERQVQSSYAVVLSTAEQKKFREKALQELTRSYQQGRTEISIFIDAMDKFSQSEIAYSTAVGDYQQALNRWAAERDELIPDTTPEAK